MELLDLESLRVGLFLFELAFLDQSACRKEDEKDAEVDRQCYIVVCFTVNASVPIFDLNTLAEAVKLLIDIAAGVGAIGVLVAHRCCFLCQTWCTKLHGKEDRYNLHQRCSSVCHFICL